MLNNTAPPKRDEFQVDAISKTIINHNDHLEGKPNYQTKHGIREFDILLNNFQVKKKRYKVLLNYDHIVWEQMDLKRCSSHKYIAPSNSAKTPTSGATVINAAPTNAAAAQKDAECEREQLAKRAAYDNISNVVQMCDVIRVSKGSTKSTSVRNAHRSLETTEVEGQRNHIVLTPTEQYLSIFYGERIVCSPIDCNRWHLRRLTLHNNDPYIVAKWYENLQNLIRQTGSRIKQLLVFINPYGGRKMGLQTYERTCKPIIQLAGIDASCIITQRANQIRDILMSHDLSPFDAICCVGGDGTVAEMINGLIMRAMQDKGLDLRRPPYIPKPALPIAIIPAGSTDTIAYSLHGTADVQTSAIHLVLSQRRGLDVCSVQNRDGIVRFCTSVMGYGYLGDVAAKSEKYRWMGTKRYEYTGVKSFLLNRGYEAEVHIFLDESELGSDQSSAECMSNENKIICNVNCERCRLVPDNDTERPTSSSNVSISVGHNNVNFELEEDDTNIQHSKNVDHNNCDKIYSNNFQKPMTEKEAASRKDMEDEIDTKDRPSSPASSSSSSNFSSQQAQTPTSDSLPNNEARRWRVIRGEFFMITAANITCACTRSPNGISRYCHLGDGHMDVVLVRKTNLLNNLRLVINTMGRNGDIRNLPFVEVYRTNQFMFKSKGNNNWIKDYNSVSGSTQPIASSIIEPETSVPSKLYSSWNCDGEVVSDLEITMNSHRQLIDVLMRGPYVYRIQSRTNTRSKFCCCCSRTD